MRGFQFFLVDYVVFIAKFYGLFALIYQKIFAPFDIGNQCYLGQEVSPIK